MNLKGQTAFVVPCHNEASIIGVTLKAISRSCNNAFIILVDDASSDCTIAEADAWCKRLQLPWLLVEHAHNEGGGRSLLHGLQAAIADGRFSQVISVEADNSLDSYDLQRLVVAGTHYSVAFATRWQGIPPANFNLSRHLLSRGASWLHRQRYAGKRSPTDWTLFYRSYQLPILRFILAEYQDAPANFAFQAWITHKVLISTQDWVDIPVEYIYRKHAQPALRRHIQNMAGHLKVWAQTR